MCMLTSVRVGRINSGWTDGWDGLVVSCRVSRLENVGVVDGMVSVSMGVSWCWVGNDMRVSDSVMSFIMNLQWFVSWSTMSLMH